MINKVISNQTHINPVETCFGRDAKIQVLNTHFDYFQCIWNL